MPVRAVTFDFWNTLCKPDHDTYRSARLEAVRETFATFGVPVVDDELTAAFVSVFERFNQRWAANAQFTHVEAAALLVDRFAPGLSSAEQAVLAEVCGGAGRGAVPDLTPNAARVLRDLADASIRLGIICDVGMSPSPVLRGFLDHHGVLGAFDHWSFSDEVGVYKPDPQIFRHALEGLGGVPPGQAAHVGDLLRTDVAGALEVGMTSIRYRGCHDDAGGVGDADVLVEAHHVIDDHDELIGLLGLG